MSKRAGVLWPWKDRIRRLRKDCAFRRRAKAGSIESAEKRLSVAFPDELRELLCETDGVSAPDGTDVIWRVDRIVSDNAYFRRNSDFRRLYMSFDQLLFFGDNGGGNQFAFRILKGEVEDIDIFEWDHENDSRLWFAEDFPDYLARALRGDSFASTQTT